MFRQRVHRFSFALVALFVGTMAFVHAADYDSEFTMKAMKECVIPEVKFVEGQTLQDVVWFFRDYPQIQKRFTDAGKRFQVRAKIDDDWKTAANGDRIPPKILPYHVRNVTLFHALKSICLISGFRFRIEKGVVRIVANKLSETPPRYWTAVNGQKMYGRWAGLLANGEGVVICRENDNEYIYALYKRLSEEDLAVVNAPVERDFMPYFYMYGGKKLLRTDHNICSAQEALREQDYIDRAVNLVEKKSYFRKISYKVFQCCDDGALCAMWDGRAYGGEIFFLPNKNVADEEEYTADYLLWLGTHTYTTVKKERRTVNAYSSCNIFIAVDIVRDVQGFYDRGDRRFDNTRNEDSGNAGDTRQDSGELAIAGSGSGVIVTKSGYLLTNAHVVDGAKKVKVKTVKGLVDAKIVRVDTDNDLALLKIAGTYKPISFSTRRKERLGASVFTLGFPRPGLQGFEPKITKGVVSGLEGYRGDVKTYQIDAAIQPGNSGGLLADEKGNLIGIVCSTLARAGKGEAVPQNVNYAIKKSHVLAFLDSIPECSDDIQESAAVSCKNLEEAVENVRECCALIVVYQ